MAMAQHSVTRVYTPAYTRAIYNEITYISALCGLYKYHHGATTEHAKQRGHKGQKENNAVLR